MSSTRRLRIPSLIKTRFCKQKPSENLRGIINPFSLERICHYQSSALDEVDMAVEKAVESQKKWQALPGVERSRKLLRIAQTLRNHAEELSILETENTGKCISETSQVDVESAAQAFEYYGNLAATCLNGETIFYGGKGAKGALGDFAYTVKEPLGVVGAIGAWNYPLQIASWKAAPALAAGCTVVYKPSEFTPLTTYFLEKFVADEYENIFNVVYGEGNVGAFLSSHPSIAKISFTGSTTTGHKINEAAAKTFKKVTMEMGGKSPLIIFSDAEIDNAVSAALVANFYSQGEICTNGTRIFVQKSVYEKFLQEFKRRAELIRLGDPMDPKTQMGPLICAEHYKKVMGYIERAKNSSARLITGGTGFSVKPGESQSYIMRPTIFADVSDDSELARDEIFGPVASVMSFVTEDDVIKRANATPYGLAGGVFTTNVTRAHNVSSALECGTVWINNYNINVLEVPFGGYKNSGMGRECGKEAIDHFVQTKSVYVNMTGVDCPFK